MSNNVFYNSGSDDWIIIERYNIRDVSFLKSSVDSIIDEYKITSSILNKSTKGINAEQYNLLPYLHHDAQYGIPLINHVKNMVQTTLKRTVKQLKAAWTVRGYENSFHTMHNHNPKYITNIGINVNGSNTQSPYGVSTVTYLDVPCNIEPHRTGDFYAILQDRNNENFNFVHSPKIGDVLIFPIWVYHGSVPQSNGLRQTLSLDFELM